MVTVDMDQIVQMPFCCEHCGTYNDRDAEFCKKCGMRIFRIKPNDEDNEEKDD